MRRFVLLAIISFLLVVPVHAQDSYTLPADLPQITPDNAAHLTRLASVGGKLPGDLAWSPDGTHLAVGTSEDVQIFDMEQPDQPLAIISGSGKVTFDGSQLVYDGQLWDITGKSLGKMPTAAPAPKYSPSGNIQVFLEGSTLQLKRKNSSVTKLILDTKYRYRDIVFSPDEHDAAVIMEHDGEWGTVLPVIQLWNIETGKFISDLPQMLEIIDTVAFHAGGAILVTSTTTASLYGGPFDNLELWNGRTGQPIKLRSYGYLPVRFSPDGRLLAFFTSEGVSLWTDHEWGELKFENYNDVPSLVFSPDSRTLVTPSNGRILLWDVSGSQVPNTPTKILETESDITEILFSPDGTLLVSTESSNIAELWDVKTGARRARLQTSEYIYTVAFSADGSLLRSDGYSTSLIWDTVTGKKRLTMPHSAVLNNDWSKAAYWGVEGGVHVADTASGEITDLYQIDPYLGNTGALSPATGRAFFIGNDVRAYDLRNGDLFFQQSINTGSPWTAFNANGSHFLTGRSPTIYGRGDPAVIDVWDSANLSQPVNTIKIPDGGNRYMSLSPDGRFLSQLNTACGDGGGGDFQLWDAQTGKQVLSFREGGCGPYDHIFTPDGKFLLVAWDMSINFIDMTAVVAQSSTEKDHNNSSKDTILFYGNHVEQIELSPDGTMLAVSVSSFYPDSSEPLPEPWVDVVKLSEVMKPGSYTEMPTDTTVHISNATQATFSPNNAFVLTENGLYDSQNGDLLADASSTMAAFSPDSKTLVTVDEHGIQLWDVAALAKGNATPLAAFPDQTVQEIAFSPDGTKLYIRHTGDVQIWGIPPVS